jgi:hypothetical protein
MFTLMASMLVMSFCPEFEGEKSYEQEMHRYP